MNIKFFKKADLEKDIRISVHRTGKLGFPSEAAIKLKLQAGMSADIGKNEDDANDTNLYMVVRPDKTGEFGIIKAGAYYYLNTKVLFDNLKVDYAKGNVVYDMSEINIEGEKVLRLKRKNQSSLPPATAVAKAQPVNTNKEEDGLPF